MFSLTKRLKEAVALTNKLDQKRFPKVLARIIAKLGDAKAVKIFTEEEEEQLSGILGLEPTELEMVLSLSRYVFEQAAYHNTTGKKLLVALTGAGMTEGMAEIYSTVWHGSKKSLVKRLQTFTLGTPNVLLGTDWQFHLNMSSQTIEKEKELKAVLRLTLGKAAGAGEEEDDEPDVCMELGREGLTNLYEKLEIIQHQLDSLTKK
mmetsp:Transcript_28627/g.50407  ORF Transcript_28627/g.50407 Transcript_28627/m.50407 type:complete len:205 (-) Transcript_28627:201-815(-)